MTINYKLCSPNTEDELKEYFYFRWYWLRKPMGMTLGTERDDKEEQAFQCMAVNQTQNILGVGRVHLSDSKAAQIRYMAVTEEARSQGIATAIVNHLISHAKKMGAINCWLNAREDVQGFYLKQGFELQGKVETDLSIPHVRMEKCI